MYDVIQKLLDNGDFYLNWKLSKLYRKQRYYSKERESEIQVDISIETYLPNASNYSMLTVIECKNLSTKAVPVDDIEEFAGKLRQLWQDNTKWIVVSSSWFQSWAISYAKNNGIWLANAVGTEALDWVVFRWGDNDDEPDNPRFHGVTGDWSSFQSVSEFLLLQGVIDKFSDKRTFIKIPYKSPELIREIASGVPIEAYYNDRIDFEKYCEFIKKNWGVVFDFSVKDKESWWNEMVLWKLHLNPLVIEVPKHIDANIQRWRFTLAHEIWHLILHYKFIKNRLENLIDTVDTCDTNSIYIDKDTMEYQANKFANELLIPEKIFTPLVLQHFTENRIFWGRMYLDDQECNRIAYRKLLSVICQKFDVSRAVARQRLLDNKLLTDERSASWFSKL